MRTPPRRAARPTLPFCGAAFVWAALAGLLVPGCGDDRALGTLINPNLGVDAGSQALGSNGPDASGVPGPDCSREDGEPGVAYDRAGCGVGGFMGGEYCGDGQVQAPEECDDGNTFEADDCSAACLRRACGNGRVDYGETCDQVDPSCDSICQIVAPPAPAVCGNAVREGLEECDDGNVVARDGCSSVCLAEGCGNRRRDDGEACDPPDSVSCDAQCQALRCGDGRLAGSEQCDDGNVEHGDGCDQVCRQERCGNGRLEPGEDCEPPGGPSCDAECHSPRAACGNGTLDVGEACDDGNASFGDGCSPTCEEEKCGNGHVEGPVEECEPPGGRSCTVRCRRPRCGDGEFSPPEEECEDGNADNGDGCSAGCRWEECGNGRLDAPEQCEPSLVSQCSSSCELLGASELAVPVGGARFTLANPGFAGSLVGWQQLEVAPALIEYNPLDLNGDADSGAAQLDAPNTTATVSLLQCVRTMPGAEYQVAARARPLPGQVAEVALDLGVQFYAGPSCSGRILDGLVTSYDVGPENGGDWSLVMLPPANFGATLIAPEGAGSLVVWFEGQGDAAVGSVLIDEVELVRVDPICGDGVPDQNEECEPGLTAECNQDCSLPRECGDGLAAPGECSGTEPCAQDCLLAAQCGDRTVALPEECDPPLAGSCSPQCTILHGNCGDRMTRAGEDCDPPNGTTCSFDCRSIACGNGRVEPPETCDPPGAECTQFCRLKREQPAMCGDRLLQGAEECDPPNPQTWCTSLCLRRNPTEACGDGRVDTDLGEECEPPGFARNCGLDCRTPVCGDGKVTGAEQCERGHTQPETCDANCQFLSNGARGCVGCLATSCVSVEPSGSGSGAAQDLFAACFDLKGVAQAGPAKGAPLRELCVEAVECMRQTGCAVEVSGSGHEPDPLACYCGKEVLTGGEVLEQQQKALALRACADGSNPPHGSCRAAFERAAEASGPGLAVAAFDRDFGRPAVLTALRLMAECGQKEGGSCKGTCSVVPACGNGVVEAGEPCDPKDSTWAGKCSDLCTLLPCGNGKVDVNLTVPETCDVADPYTNVKLPPPADGSPSLYSCSNTCQLRTDCGDGRLTVSVEACDPGANGSWVNCCRPTQDGPPGEPSHLQGCDRDRSGTISEQEGCQYPSFCGNGKVEGLEQCDPPEAGKCDAECRKIDDSPCAVCTRANCGDQIAACFDNVQSFSGPCQEVFRCIEETNCASDGVLETCLCGALDLFSCNQQRGTGVCADVIIEHSDLCPDGSPGCIFPKLKLPEHPTGAATQLVQCKGDFCFEACFGG